MSIDMQSAYEHEVALESGVNPLADNGSDDDFGFGELQKVEVEYGDDE